MNLEVLIAVIMIASFILVILVMLHATSFKGACIFMLLILSISGSAGFVVGDALQLRSDLAAEQEKVSALQNESVDKQDEIDTLEATLEKKFSNAALPRGNSNIYYDIALPKELQLYTYQCCSYFGVDYKLFISLMYTESRYDINAINGGKYIGLVQMSVDNVEYIERQLGVDIDIYNPYDNILAGVYWLSRYVAKYPNDVCMQLQCYNMGEAGAKKNKNNTTYYNNILSYYLNF